MPAAGLEVSRLYLAEGDEEHTKDKRGLQDTDGLVDKAARAFKKGKTRVDEVEHHAHKHGDGEGPVLVEAEEGS